MRPFPLPVRRTGACYIITTFEYVIKCTKEEPVKASSSEVAAKFIYQNFITIFGCPLTLIID